MSNDTKSRIQQLINNNRRPHKNSSFLKKKLKMDIKNETLIPNSERKISQKKSILGSLKDSSHYPMNSLSLSPVKARIMDHHIKETFSGKKNRKKTSFTISRLNTEMGSEFEIKRNWSSRHSLAIEKN